ncbi:MAG: hypothetical protein ACRD1R_10370 [Acidobacteriota bacterium]
MAAGRKTWVWFVLLAYVSFAAGGALEVLHPIEEGLTSDSQTSGTLHLLVHSSQTDFIRAAQPGELDCHSLHICAHSQSATPVPSLSQAARAICAESAPLAPAKAAPFLARAGVSLRGPPSLA